MTVSSALRLSATVLVRYILASSKFIVLCVTNMMTIDYYITLCYAPSIVSSIMIELTLLGLIAFPIDLPHSFCTGRSKTDWSMSTLRRYGTPYCHFGFLLSFLNQVG